MPKEIAVVHHADRRRDVMMPYAPGIVVRRGSLVFLSGVTAAPVYHHHPHREEDFDLPATMREQAVLCMENLKKTLEAAGATFADLVFLSGVTAAPVFHHHPHREEDFDLPATMREQAVLCMENLKKTLEAAGATFAELVSATRFLTDVAEQDDLNRVWAAYLGGHLPTTTTVEVSRLATHPRCKIETGRASWR